jgi:uncharacterized protein (DUF302 family)
MTYYFSKTLDTGFDAALERTTVALKEAGFGIITEIDLKETFKKKLGIDYRDYRILGACNPRMAHEALSIEDKAGTMLPCNVIVQDIGSGKVEVAAIDPVASMASIENKALLGPAEQVRMMLKGVIDRL